MWWMISPSAAASIARQQTVDEVRESRRLRVNRFTPEPDDEKTAARRRHRTRRTGFRGVAVRQPSR